MKVVPFDKERSAVERMSTDELIIWLNQVVPKLTRENLLQAVGFAEGLLYRQSAEREE